MKKMGEIENPIHFIQEIEFKNNVQRQGIICDKLKQYQILPKIQKFTVKKKDGENIIVIVPGISKQKVIIGAHYDIWRKSGGANDNGAAVYILFQLILHFAKMDDLNYTFEFIFFDWEESHLLGSKMYLESENLDDILAMINLDMCGIGDTLIFNQAVNEKFPLSSILHSICDNESVLHSMLQHLPPGDDLAFSKQGILAISLAIIPHSVIPTVIRLANVTRTKKLTWSRIKDSVLFAFDMIKGQEVLETMHSSKDTVDTLSQASIEIVYMVTQKFLLAINQHF